MLISPGVLRRTTACACKAVSGRPFLLNVYLSLLVFWITGDALCRASATLMMSASSLLYQNVSPAESFKYVSHDYSTNTFCVSSPSLIGVFSCQNELPQILTA